MTEATHTSETSVLTRTTRRHIPEYGILHSHCLQNFKSYRYYFRFIKQLLYADSQCIMTYSLSAMIKRTSHCLSVLRCAEVQLLPTILVFQHRVGTPYLSFMSLPVSQIILCLSLSGPSIVLLQGSPAELQYAHSIRGEKINHRPTYI
jgi:hypothetical protein